MEVNMDVLFKDFAFKLMRLLILTPVGGYVFLLCYDKLEKVWRSNIRSKRWFVMCIVFFIVACMGGWLW